MGSRKVKGSAEVEAFLDRHEGLVWRFEAALPLTEIDMAASLANQSRFDPLDVPTVERYVTAIEDGAVFPPIIVRGQVAGAEGLVILGGVHRTEALRRAGRVSSPAYVVLCEDLVALEVAYGDNATHGLPPSEAERLAHAVHLVELGRDGATAARVVGINPQRVYRQLTSRRVDKRAADLGVAAELQLVAASIRPRLESLGDDDLFVRVIRAIIRENLDTGSAVGLIGDLNQQPTKKAALELLAVHVQEARARHAQGDVGRPVGRPSRNKYLMYRTSVSTVGALNPADIVEEARDWVELRRVTLDLARYAKAILDLGEAKSRGAA